jgi:hypothetical protein
MALSLWVHIWKKFHQNLFVKKFFKNIKIKNYTFTNHGVGHILSSLQVDQT